MVRQNMIPYCIISMIRIIHLYPFIIINIFNMTLFYIMSHSIMISHCILSYLTILYCFVYYDIVLHVMLEIHQNNVQMCKSNVFQFLDSLYVVQSLCFLLKKKIIKRAFIYDMLHSIEHFQKQNPNKLCYSFGNLRMLLKSV